MQSSKLYTNFEQKDLKMVRLTKKEKQDKLELLASSNQMNIESSQNIDNRKYMIQIVFFLIFRIKK